MDVFDRTGLNVLLLMHIIAGRSGDDIYRPSSNIGSLGAGSIDTITGYNLRINRVRTPAGAGHVTMNRAAGGVRWDSLFEGTGPLVAASFYVQVDGRTRVELSPAELDDAGTGFIRYVPATGRDEIRNIVAGTELLLGLALPA